MAATAGVAWANTLTLVAPMGSAARTLGPLKLGFKTASLGMTLAAWKAAPFPGLATPHLSADCAPSGIAQAGGAPPVFESCRYLTRYGGTEFSRAFPLFGRFLARNARYDFVGDRLSRIEFRTSIDAFNDVVAWLDQTYGGESETLRAQTQRRGAVEYRVTKIWRLAGGSIQLVDPSSAPNQLEVIFTSR